ncbi:MAG: SUMF1/EgtB/PvdO family nonheme iron enzyme, partial [Anaerolineales bacterium]|nr:SUMF1/EgtB/PvdO family nonheme iron enzyme [Anaerolineales bacterium]
MPDEQGSMIVNDLPADKDALDFMPYVLTLADIIESPTTSTPLTIGVFGGWGSGKTSLMRMVSNHLPGSVRKAWFDAWKYDKEETLWRALLVHVLQAVQNAIPNDDGVAIARLTDLQTLLYQDIDREELGKIEVDAGKLLSGLGTGALQIGLSFLPVLSTMSKLVEELQKEGGTTATAKLVEAIKCKRSEIHIEQIQFLEQFHEKFAQVVDAYLVKKNLRLVVFIDDLDRCLPEKAIEVLEAIKLFLDVPGCVFVLGLDQEVIARGIEMKYREFGLVDLDGKTPAFTITGAHYLEKIIQLPFQIPPIEREDMSSFVNSLVGSWPHDACPEVFAVGLGDNPRKVKRTVNVFLLLWSLAQRRDPEIRIKPVRLAKVVAIQQVSPQLYELLKRTPRLLRELETYYRSEEKIAQSERVKKEEMAQVERPDPPPALAGYIHQTALRQILTLHPETIRDVNFIDQTPVELRRYFTLTRRAEAPVKEPVEQPRLVFEPQLVSIPAGPFLMGSTEEDIKAQINAGLNSDWVGRQRPQHTVELPAYAIGKYPVTNAEYALFVQETGHTPPSHWDSRQYPEDKSDHPVVYVNLEDARTYCTWLAGKTGKDYRLPTEAEWEKAARGTDGWIYPWGDQFDPKKCNTDESGQGDTTPVGQYSPAGDSPFGAADMAGNVWEWTASQLKEYPYSEDQSSKGGL